MGFSDNLWGGTRSWIDGRGGVSGTGLDGSAPGFELVLEMGLRGLAVGDRSVDWIIGSKRGRWNGSAGVPEIDVIVGIEVVGDAIEIDALHCGEDTTYEGCNEKRVWTWSQFYSVKYVI